MRIEPLQRSACELIVGSGENELRVLFSMGMQVGLLFQGSFAVLRYEDRKFRTTNMHLADWMGRKKALQNAQTFSVVDLDAMIGRLMVRVMNAAHEISLIDPSTLERNGEAVVVPVGPAIVTTSISAPSEDGAILLGSAV